ncbi:MAG TPA: class I SAM-dependent methyltransferase [Candidatus Acidoferrum sp.]|nr:class I SAM-dependent methyltransferase [Candidatus Acidoferrum sp.]
MHGYLEDLAYIHDAGFRDYACSAAPGLERILASHGIVRGLVVDLGCGSGRWAGELVRAGYDVLGIDQSPAMIRLARKVAPRARFQVGSLWSVRLPPCDAVTSIGECLNYCFDPRAGRRALSVLFKRVYRVLEPGGILLCDFAGPHRSPHRKLRQHISAGRDWAVMASTLASGPHSIVRHIATYRRVGNRYRRREEVHRLRLFLSAEICNQLRRSGFRVRTLNGYGRFRFPRGIQGVLGIKPGPRTS